MAEGGDRTINFVSRSCGVDPVFCVLEKEAPFCPHGPALLFRRYYTGKNPREFWACAVYRDRKGCPFFCWADEKIGPEKRQRWKKAFDDEQSRHLVTDAEVMECIRSLPLSQRQYCMECGVLVSHLDLTSHSGHTMTTNITDTQLRHPTSFLCPVDNRKSQAQFYFSDLSLKFLHSELKRLQFSKVLCIGTPRLHELLLDDSEVDSLLLDIDHRYVNFFSNREFQRYNMFNHFFYSPGGLQVCESFLNASPSTTAIVVDPPFGGLAEILAVTLKKLWEVSGRELITLLVFPYYLESHVVTALPSLWMSDYQVTYKNHPHFGTARKQGRPSPVRIFTNLPHPGLQLPVDEGYWYCEVCNRYVAEQNAHCDKCACCTSKDGRPYAHCELCGKCSKKGHVHCSTCNKCEPEQHICGTRSVGCHVCGSEEHKRKDCPDLQAILPPCKKKKRTRSTSLLSRKEHSKKNMFLTRKKRIKKT